MKIKLKTIILLFIYATLAMSCNKDDGDKLPQNTTVSEVKSIAQNGNWRITYFYDSDHEETDHFNGYAFAFNADGALVANNGNTTVSGTWSVTDSNSNDDDGSTNDLDFNLFFASPPNFEELSDDWDIISISNSKIELIDVSGGNGGTDLLTFQRI